MKKLIDRDIEIAQLRFDYAWKWFDFHATQRTTVFNYFLIITGILATACVSLFTNKQYLFLVAACILGALCAFAFFMLDIRNRILLRLAEDVLADLEREHIFTTPPDKDEKRSIHSIILRDMKEADHHPSFFVRNLAKHKVCIRTIEAYIGLVFIIAAIVGAHLWIADSFLTKPAQHISDVKAPTNHINEDKSRQLLPGETGGFRSGQESTQRVTKDSKN